MPEEIDLTDEQDAALQRAWQKIGTKIAATPKSPPDAEEPVNHDAEPAPQPPLDAGK